jgi:hypothetical protein
VGYQTIHALDHSISNLGIGTTSEKIKGVKEFPTPTNTKALQRFLGLAVYYWKFVKDFAQKAAPLYKLLKKEQAWEWDKAAQQAVQQLQEAFTTSPTLAHPNYNKPFLLYMDASTIGLGAVLAQLDEHNHEHPIIYLSRTLNRAEKNYTSTEKECLAIIWAVKKLHADLDGCTFTIITDHTALQWLLDFNGSNKRLAWWSMELQPYRPHMTIRYRAGRVHENADPLSRAPLAETNHLAICNHIPVAKVDSSLYNSIKCGYLQDKDFGQIYASVQLKVPPPHIKRFNVKDGILYYQDPSNDHRRTCIPDRKRVRLDILHDFHNAVSAGHLGYNKTYSSISRTYYWSRMGQDIKNYIRSCSSCQRNKNPSAGP